MSSDDKTTRMPEPSDFTMKYDDDHTFDFFEDENADHLWAFGTIDAAEFARQANEYDILSGWIQPGEVEPYTAADIRYCQAVITTNNGYVDWYIRPVPEGTISGLVAVIDR